MAETGIGLSASEYYFQADGFIIDDLSVATDTEVAYWTPNYNGVNSYVEIPEWNATNKEVTGTARKSDGTLVDINTVVTSTTIGKLDNGNFFEGQISNLKLVDKTNPSNSRFYPGIIYSYVDPDATDVPMPSSTVLVDEWSEDGSTNGTMINFGTTQPYVPLLGDREEYWAGLADGDWKRGVNLAEQRFTMNGSSSGRQGSLPNNINQTTMPIQSLLVASNVTVKVGEIVNNMAIVFDSNGNSDDSIQHAFQYPNTFKVIKPTDPDHPDFR